MAECKEINWTESINIPHRNLIHVKKSVLKDVKPSFPHAICMMHWKMYLLINLQRRYRLNCDGLGWCLCGRNKDSLTKNYQVQPFEEKLACGTV